MTEKNPEDMTLQELGQLGEQYALRRLLHLGFDAIPTSPNARDIDILKPSTLSET